MFNSRHELGTQKTDRGAPDQIESKHFDVKINLQFTRCITVMSRSENGSRDCFRSKVAMTRNSVHSNLTSLGETEKTGSKYSSGQGPQ